MRLTARLITTASALATLIGVLSLSPQLANAADESVIAQGKKIAFDRKKGNCLACHKIEGGDLPGNIGPPLVAMKARYPDKAKLRAQIYDPTKANPNTIMPPFGKHGILSDKEIDAIVEWVHSL